MFEYLVLDLAFMLLATLVIGLNIGRIKLKNVLIALLVIVLLTTVFDQILIMLSIVKYHPAKLTGIYIGKAPIEDFAYSVVAACLMPVFWQRAKHHDK